MSTTTADFIARALIDKFGGTEPAERGQWAHFRELARRTGGSDRYADLFVVGLWPSNPRAIVFEIKVSRADFQREIDNPTKRTVWEPLSTEGYFATPPGLVKVDEVPEGWGLMTVGETGAVKTLKKALQRPPPVWPFAFAQALARRTADPPPVFDAATTVELASGNRIGLPALRRLVDRFYAEKLRKAGARATFEEQLRERDRPSRVELGSMRRILEQHFRRAITSAEHLRSLLAEGVRTHQDREIAWKLRDLANALDGCGEGGRPDSVRCSTATRAPTRGE